MQAASAQTEARRRATPCNQILKRKFMVLKSSWQLLHTFATAERRLHRAFVTLARRRLELLYLRLQVLHARFEFRLVLGDLLLQRACSSAQAMLGWKSSHGIWLKTAR